jgi:adenosylmethionine-8-amino-7-oxononanoate aminotransferase
MPFGDIIGLAPPLILSKADAEEIVDRLYKAYRTALDELTPAQRAGEIA